MSGMKLDVVRALNDQAVKHLVDAHTRLDPPLVLAVRYKLDAPGIHLLEVVESPLGDDADPPMETTYGPSPDVRMVGPLVLVLASPGQFRALAAADSPVLPALRVDGRVEYAVGEGMALAVLLGLQNRASPHELEARRKLLGEAGTVLTTHDREALHRAWG